MAIAVLLMEGAVSGNGGSGLESPFTFGAGARGMGMGRAFVALSGDASAPFWNPAASALLDRAEVTVFHTTLFLDTRYDCFGLSYPLADIGVFSVSAGRLGSENIEKRDINNINIGEFSSMEAQFGLSYARSAGFGLSGGITFKAANQRIGGVSGTGFGADLGFQYRPLFVDGLTLGAGFNDLVHPGIKLENVEDKYQPLSRFGASYLLAFNNRISSTGSLELTSSHGKSAQMHAGIELEFYKQFFLRAGADKNRISFGAGLVYNFVKLDYAFENVEFLGGSHRISIGFMFGRSITRSRSEARAKIVEQEKVNWLNSLQSEQRLESERFVAAGDSLMGSGKFQEALVFYQRSLFLDSTRSRAQMMSDSMITVIKVQAVGAVGDQKRKELIAGRIGSATEDFKNGFYNESIAKLNLLLEIDPGNKSVTDFLSTVEETRRKEINDRAAMARSNQNKRDYVNALAQWNRLLTLDRANAEAPGQIAYLERQIRADRLMAVAVAAMNERKFTEAAGFLRQAQDIRPDDATIRSLMIDARAKAAPPTTLENIKSSQKDWEKYLSGLESYQSGDYAGALRIWEDLRQSYPNNSELDNNIDQARQRLAAESGR